MNYRHAFHAGNFADVFKHIIIARILTHLREKIAPFRVIDTHAGEGLYDLAGDEASRTGEWRDGIGRLAEAKLPADAAELMAPYFSALHACNRADDLRYTRDLRRWRATSCVRRIALSLASLSRTPRPHFPVTCGGPRPSRWSASTAGSRLRPTCR
jgi:23S rRNA A2030 N6-methylase RlmJ